MDVPLPLRTHTASWFVVGPVHNETLHDRSSGLIGSLKKPAVPSNGKRLKEQHLTDLLLGTNSSDLSNLATLGTRALLSNDSNDSAQLVPAVSGRLQTSNNRAPHEHMADEVALRSLSCHRNAGWGSEFGPSRKTCFPGSALFKTSSFQRCSHRFAAGSRLLHPRSWHAARKLLFEALLLRVRSEGASPDASRCRKLRNRTPKTSGLWQSKSAC